MLPDELVQGTFVQCSGAVELAVSHGMPVTEDLAQILGTAKLNVSMVSNSALASCVACLFKALCLLLAILVSCTSTYVRSETPCILRVLGPLWLTAWC